GMVGDGGGVGFVGIKVDGEPADVTRASPAPRSPATVEKRRKQGVVCRSRRTIWPWYHMERNFKPALPPARQPPWKEAVALTADVARAGSAAIARAAALLRAGRLVAFPTETVYGLGGDATNDRAVAAIFAAKARPHFNPL